MKRKISLIFFIIIFFTTNVRAISLQSIFSEFFSKPALSEQTDTITYNDTIDHWCNVSAKKLYAEGIFTGMKIGKNYYFMPEEYITRGEFLIYLNAILDLPSAKNTALPFADEKLIPSWQRSTVNSMYEKGYVKGNIEKGSLFFNHDEKISRLECAIILNNFLELENTEQTTKYYDNYLIPPYAVASVKNVTDYGLMQGYEDNSFRPYVKITRGMLADILCKVKDYKSSVDKSE